ncbi:MAG: aminopeptidase P family protein [Acidobacteria bacterium]|nr:aminopeptidase P family protein [Acidobacteriota bacterium]
MRKRHSRPFLCLLAFWLFASAHNAQAAQELEPPEVYAARRATLRNSLGGGLLVLFGNDEPSGSEAYFRFRQESNFYYLTGYDEPGALLAVASPFPSAGSPAASSDLSPEILFLPRHNPQQEQWTGPKPDPDRLATLTPNDLLAVKEAETFESEMRRYARAYRVVYTLLPSSHATQIQQAPARERIAQLQKLFPSADIRDARRLLARLRQVKSETELNLIRRAVDCTVSALDAAAKEVRPGLFEYQVAALIKYTFERAGCLWPSFDPIVASGPRSTILHYNRNTARVESGDLIVLDVGGEYSRYAADITRTLPVSGRFTPRQREIYEIVLGAQKAVIQAVRPGVKFPELQRIAYNYINSHGKDSRGARLGKYFTHGVSHHVGLDVHDPAEPGAELQPNMVITVEPGIYLPEENLGVRLEDMVLVTKTGSVVLTEKLPREAEEVEAWMGR